MRMDAGDIFKRTGSGVWDELTTTSLERLRRLTRSDSDLTEARIAELRDRVASGVYLSRNAAELTASRLLDENFDLEVLS